MNTFLRDETGAVTVDWVVLTAALVGLGLAVMGVVASGTEDLTGDIDEQLTDGSIIRTAFTGGSVSGASAACGAAGVSCAGMDASALSGMTGTAFDAEVASWAAAGNPTAADAAAANTAANFVQDDTGTWGTYADPNDTTSTFTADAGANTAYNQGVANDAYSAALAAEGAARQN